MDFKKIEKKWQDKWAKEKVFEANPIFNQKKYFITVPYPYTNGPQHIGHGRTFTCGDAFARYKRLKGYNVLFPMAFHITGTPVLAISRGIQNNDKIIKTRFTEYVALDTKNKDDVKKIVESFKEPWNIVNYFAKTFKTGFDELGTSIDWRRSFTTGDTEYNAFVTWQFNKLKDKNYLEKGKYPILFCLNDQNAVGEDDILSGDEIDLAIQEYTCIKYPYKDGYLVASTLRPETVYGVTNIWINPQATYVKVKINDDIWYISKKAASKLEYQDKTVKILEEFKGKELIGDKCKTPINNRDIIILPATFVDDDNATGVVYSVPAHAPFDYIALMDFKKDVKTQKQYGFKKEDIDNIKIIQIINLEGYTDFPAKEAIEQFEIKNQNSDKLKLATEKIYKDEFYKGILNDKCEDFKGLKVADAKEKVIEKLNKTNKIDKFYRPITPTIKCRCGGDVIVHILDDQWFLNFNQGTWKKDAFDCLNNMNITPSKYRTFFENVFNWLDKRPTARKRGLGTKLPFDTNWIIEALSDSTIYMAFYTIINKIKENKIPSDKLNIELFDYVFLNKGAIKEVSKKTGINETILKEMQDEFNYWYPLDHRHTAIMHISNHLSFFIFHHTAIFPKNKWPKTITLLEPVTVEGSKMGKSKGNVLPLIKTIRKYSADVFRLYILTSAGFASSVDWREIEVEKTQKHIDKITSLIQKYYNNNNNNVKIKQTTNVKALVSRFTQKIIDAESNIESFDLQKYAQIIIFDIYNLISAFEKRANDDEKQILNEIINTWIITLSPIIPHICEELFEIYQNKGFVAKAEWPKTKNKKIDTKSIDMMDFVDTVIEDIHNIKKQVRIETKQINIYISPLWKFTVRDLVFDNKNNAKGLIPIVMKNVEARKQGDLTVKYISNLTKEIHSLQKYELTQENEINILNEAKKVLEAELKCNIQIENSDKSKSDKAKRAEPGKPGIEIL
ncbi:MAG: leucine--tRNA ligase [DPANN group archaeon]|nr:leucine--tRNA ligase [DPANN group archaeon]